MNKLKKLYRLGMPLRTREEIDYLYGLDVALKRSGLSDVEKAMQFPLYAPRQNISTFLVKYELFKRILNVHGSIIECGVAYGSGLMSFAMLSAVFEPSNYSRKVIGFDTFAGFPSLTEKDNGGDDPNAKKGGMKVKSFDEIKRCAALYDKNRFLNHINKIELVKGDLIKSAPEYVKDNPHLVVALLYLDLDLYEPTKAAIQVFVPRMPKGGIIVFDELNHPDWPGETLAVLEGLGMRNLKIERFPFDSVRSFAVLE